MARPQRREMTIQTAGMFMAWAYTSTVWYSGETRGWDCSITQDGPNAIVYAPAEAWRRWDAQMEYSSPCVYWP